MQTTQMLDITDGQSIEIAHKHFHCMDITLWDVVAEANALENDQVADQSSLKYLRNISDPSEQSKNEILTALQKIIPDMNKEKYGDLLMKYWLLQLESGKINSVQFVEKLKSMVYATDYDEFAPCCDWALSVFHPNNGYGFQELASLNPIELHDKIISYK